MILNGIIQFIFCGLTNFSGIPAIYIIIKKRLYVEAYVSFLTFFVSFIYHTLEAFKIERFILTEDEWHQIDNLGSVVCFSQYIISTTNLDRKTKLTLLYAQLFVCIVVMQLDPWNILSVVLPIVIFAVLCTAYNFL